MILLLILPVALLVPWWRETRPVTGWKSWYLGMLGAVLLGAVIGLAWAIPAGFSGGEEYRKLIFWGQSAGRIANSFAHKRPFWWYTLLLPVLLFPWVAWPPVIRGLKRLTLDQGLRVCITHALSVLILFSFISGKQVHYLLPMLPALALLMARTVSPATITLSRTDQRLIGLTVMLGGLVFALMPLIQSGFGLAEPDNEVARIAEEAPLLAKLMLIGAGALLLWWQPGDLFRGMRSVVLLVFAVLITAHLIYRQLGWTYYNMQPFADHLAEVELKGSTIVHWRKYNGDFNFLGRLQQPIREVTTRDALNGWMMQHPQGYVIVVHRGREEALEDGAVFAQYYRGSRRIMLWRASALVADPGHLEKLLD